MRRRYPVLREMRSGEVVVGIGRGFAVDQYSTGAVPVHGLKDVDLDLIAGVWIGDSLRIERRGTRWWIVSDDGRPIGRLTWTAANDGKRHAVTGVRVNYPVSGWLHVDRVRQLHGTVTNVEGRAVPTSSS